MIQGDPLYCHVYKMIDTQEDLTPARIYIRYDAFMGARGPIGRLPPGLVGDVIGDMLIGDDMRREDEEGGAVRVVMNDWESESG